jgi:hypothetical protein
VDSNQKQQPKQQKQKNQTNATAKQTIVCCCCCDFYFVIYNLFASVPVVVWLRERTHRQLELHLFFVCKLTAADSSVCAPKKTK